MENQVQRKYLWILGLLKVNAYEHVSGEEKRHLQSLFCCWSDFGHEMPIRFPTTAKMKGDIYHLSCLLHGIYHLSCLVHSYIDVNKLLTNYTKNLVRQKKKLVKK